MQNSKPLDDPLPYMETLGYHYTYKKGLIDATDHYTRVEEDSMIWENDKRFIQFNLASRCIVIQLKEDNANYYGGMPTFFLDNELLKCIEEIRHKLGWDE